MSTKKSKNLDLKGYKCPLPVLKARKAMYGSAKGTQFSIDVSDPKAPTDFKDFCDVAGYRLLSVTQTGFGHKIDIEV